MFRNFLKISDCTKEELLHLLEDSAKLKQQLKDQTDHQRLKGKSLAMIFEKPSSRTRISFEVGMFQLGGQALNINANDIKMGEREPAVDVSRTISRYVDAVMIRALHHWTLEEFSSVSTVPVINGLSDHHHPCQALADIFTIKEYKKNLENVNICYIGDGNNVCNSLIEICKLLEINLRIACPPGYEPLLKEKSGFIQIINNPQEACKDVDVIYTDVWVSMGQEELTARKISAFQGFNVNEKLFKCAKKDALFMHCLPAHRGLEVDTEVFESKRSVVFDQAENRLHCHKAILSFLLNK
jgi:ornithine carbamoyltransferase